VRRPFSRLAERLVSRLLFRPVPLQPHLVEQMRREASALDGFPADVIDLWDGLRRQLRQQLAAADPADFLRWPAVQRTMVKRDRRRVRPELAHLRARPDWRRRWRSVLRETTVGRPSPLSRCPWSSVNSIFQAYHLCRFEEVTGRSLASMRTIVEFGGGYGRLCHLAHDLGFRGTYVIFDLPEVAVLQRFYLRHVGIAASAPHDAIRSGSRVVTVVDVSDLLAVLSARGEGPAAFVAIGSLSEAPLPLRETVLAQVATFDAFLVFYAAQHDALDNRAYFARWRRALPQHVWTDVAVPHYTKAASYLFGVRRSGR
jgi:hypothetical protein